MAKFRFRMQKLLEYRELQETWAKDAYIDAQAKRIAAEDDIDKLKTKRRRALSVHLQHLNDRLSLDDYVSRLDDDERSLEAVLSVLLIDEDKARSEWIAAKSEREAISKLRESDYETWMVEENRREQKELDEWAVTRRAA